MRGQADDLAALEGDEGGVFHREDHAILGEAFAVAVVPVAHAQPAVEAFAPAVVHLGVAVLLREVRESRVHVVGPAVADDFVSGDARRRGDTVSMDGRAEGVVEAGVQRVLRVGLGAVRVEADVFLEGHLVAHAQGQGRAAVCGEGPTRAIGVVVHLQDGGPGVAEARGLGAVPGVGTAGVGGGEPILAADGVPVIGFARGRHHQRADDVGLLVRGGAGCRDPAEGVGPAEPRRGLGHRQGHAPDGAPRAIVAQERPSALAHDGGV